MEIILIKSYTDKPWRNAETYQRIENSLKERWSIHAINTKDPFELRQLITELNGNREKEIFVFNIAEFLDEENKAGFIPTFLEEWEVPHLGSTAETIAIGLDKARTKSILEEKEIPTPRYFIADQEDNTNKERADEIGYPLIVKPNSEGGHIGIKEDSIVNDSAELERIIKRVFVQHDQPALVEEYINGRGMREFSAGIIDGEPRLFTPIEIDYDAMDVEKEILSFEAAQKDLEETKLVFDEKIRDEIIELAKKTFDAVGARDYSRVDLRMNHTDCYVLEINTMPGLGPHSFLPVAAKEIHDLDYHELIQKIAAESMRRQGIKEY
jgi:D-alanine-D-alanine ligase